LFQLSLKPLQDLTSSLAGATAMEYPKGIDIDALPAGDDLSPTALRHGIALFHCHWQSLDRFVGVACLMCLGIPFDAGVGTVGQILPAVPGRGPHCY
jgi:hypothetical protein